MDTWATSSLTPQIAAGWSTADDVFAQVFPMDLRPQAHEIIRTWLFYTVLRGAVEEDRSAALAARGDLGLDPGPGPQEDVQVHGERGDRRGPAARVRNGRGPVLGRERAARRGHGVRPGAAQDRPTAGDQDPEREPVRARHRRRGGQRRTGRAGHRADRPGAAAETGRHDRPVHRGVRGLRPRRWPWSRPSGSSGSSATTTWSWSSRAPTASAARRPPRRRWRRCARHCRWCCGCWRRSCRS